MNLYKVVLMDKGLEVRQGETLPPGKTYISNIMAEDIEKLVSKLVEYVLPEHQDMRVVSIKEYVTNVK